MDPDEILRRRAQQDQADADLEGETREQTTWNLNVAASAAATGTMYAKADRDKAVASLLNALAFLIVLAALVGAGLLIVEAFR